MISFLKTLFAEPRFDPLIEGVYADEYPEYDGVGPRTQIRRAYAARWTDPAANPTPLTHPWLFDPCEPPQGWRYDPYYECWINFKEEHVS